MKLNVTTVGDYLQKLESRLMAANVFFGHGTDNAADEALYLVFCTLGLDFNCPVSVYNRVLNRQEICKLDSFSDRRIDERMPVAYLVGKAWFAGYVFYVNQDCLIPRSPIAELIAGQFATICPSPPTLVLDLCCGSGCIGIAAALEIPCLQVDLADISAPALQLAEQNIAHHKLAARVKVIGSDLFQCIESSYQLILTNPPYVSQTELDQLPTEYSWEPVLGLLSEQNGLDLPLRILRQVADYLTENGVLIMEVGHSADALQERLPEVPFLWLDFASGGAGVFVLTRPQLLKYKEYF